MVHKYEKSWARTRASLAQAAAFLPSSVRTDAGLGRADYQDYRDHNELELALDILEDCAQNISVPAAFWHAALAAADNMALPPMPRAIASLSRRSLPPTHQLDKL